MKYKFIACDYDDTLLPKSGVISDFTKDTIREYIARGGRFAICTGRMFKSIVKIAREFGLHGEIISYQGSLIKNIDTEETLLVNDIDKDLAVDYVEFMKKTKRVSAGVRRGQSLRRKGKPVQCGLCAVLRGAA